MAKNNPSRKKTTTIQVHADLKDQLDLLKIMSKKDDLNAVISELVAVYVDNTSMKIDPKIARFIRKLKK